MGNVLIQLSDALAETVATAGAGVVRVEGRRRIPASGILWSAEGHVLTANHVVRRDENIQVGLADGRRLGAAVVGRDPATDLALLKIEGDDLRPVERNAVEAHVGNLVLALGRPGPDVQATLGIVSATGQAWRTRRGGNVDNFIQTDVVMYPGFSGGPLVGAGGDLIGLNTSALAQGVSLTLPIATLDRVTAMLQSHGRVRRGYLGVSTQQVRLPEAQREELGQKSGLLLVAVEPGSPAEAGGLVLGDTIVALDGTAVRNHDDLLGLLAGERVGRTAPVRILRGGQLQSIDVTIGERP